MRPSDRDPRSRLYNGAMNTPALLNPLALAPPFVNTSPGPQYRSGSRKFQGIPGIERAPNGRLWATWYGGGEGEGPENYVVLVSSIDDGATWSQPAVVIDPPGQVRAFDECLWLDPHGRLWLFWAQSYEWTDGRCGVWAIHTDQPGLAHPTWSEPRRLADGIMMNKPTVLRDGTWLMPAAVWVSESVKEPFRFPEYASLRFSNVYASTDDGNTWTRRGFADVPQRLYDEHMIVERSDGSLLMWVRTRYGIGQSISHDKGTTWSPGEPIRYAPSTRFFLRPLRSGRWLLVHHDHPSARSHLTAWLSEDEGNTWSHRLLLDERAGVSYPDGCEDEQGVIRIIYDRNRTADRDILMATFTEADVIAGGLVSAASRLRSVVDHGATPM